MSAERPSWNDYFFNICTALSERATCSRGRSACVIVKDHRILATGYVGTAPKQPHCDEVGHLLQTIIHADGSKSQHCIRTIHAEQNAFMQAARYGISLEGGKLYCTMTPCRQCTVMLIMAGITEVLAQQPYQLAKYSEDLLSAAAVKISYRNPNPIAYE